MSESTGHDLSAEERLALEPGAVVEYRIGKMLSAIRTTVARVQENPVVVVTDDGQWIGVKDQLALVAGAGALAFPNRTEFAPEDQKHAGEQLAAEGEKGLQGPQETYGGTRPVKHRRCGPLVLPEVLAARREALEWYAAEMKEHRRVGPALVALLEKHPGIEKACGVRKVGTIQLNYWRHALALPSRQRPQRSAAATAPGPARACQEPTAELVARCEALGEECELRARRVAELVARCEALTQEVVALRAAAPPAESTDALLEQCAERIALVESGKARLIVLEKERVEVAEAVEVVRTFSWAVRRLRRLALPPTTAATTVTESGSQGEDAEGGAR